VDACNGYNCHGHGQHHCDADEIIEVRI